MNGNLLDTNVIIRVLRSDEDAIGFLNGLDEVYLSSIVVGELFYGANKSTKTVGNIEMIKKLIDGVEILSVDEETAIMYAEIKNNLASSGFNLPENDLWIAATAKKYGLTLATFDNHFKLINDIETVGIEDV
jgi:tRNA(fMet)-specific endonuclease VapC